MATTTNTINVSELTPDQIKELETQIRARRNETKRAEKYSKFEPHFSAYRKAVTDEKTARTLKKELREKLVSMGFSKKTTPAASTTQKTGKRK